MSQSAASQTVQHLEEQLEVTLIDRSQRPWRLTAEGKIFYDGCRDLLGRYAALANKLKGDGGPEREVRVACIYSVGLRHMKYFAQKFSEGNSGAHVHIDYLHPDRVIEGVLAGEADIGLVSFPKSTRDIAVIPWKSETMVVACSLDHPFAVEKQVPVARLADEKFVAFDVGLSIRSEIDRFLRKHDISVNVVQEFDNIESIKRAIEIGSGLAILPRPTLDRELVEGTLKVLPLEPEEFYRPLGIIHRRDKSFGPNLSKFIDLLQSEKETEVPEVAPALEKARAGAR